MIIKGLFRRYQRWNPVHPTLGAFWGMGIGIGCGVGWGPGFGPEVVGYVGAGCGAGFSVGFTLAGIGIGLPANYVYTVPYNAFMATRSGALEITQSSTFLSMRNVVGDGWCNFRENIPGLQQKASGLFPGFGIKNPLEKGMDISNMKTAIFSSTKPMMNQLERIRSHFFHPQKGMKFLVLVNHFGEKRGQGGYSCRWVCLRACPVSSERFKRVTTWRTLENISIVDVFHPSTIYCTSLHAIVNL